MTLPIIPLRLAFGTQLSYECDVRTLEQQKDPGLIQSRVVAGLNSVKVSIAVNQIVDNGDSIEEFLGYLKGTEPFIIDPAIAPPEIQGLAFRCKDYTINTVGRNAYGKWSQMQATFVQTFRPAALV